MHSQVLFGNLRTNRHRVKHLHEEVVDFDVKSAQYFFSEGESFSHVTRLMVSTEQHHGLGVVQLNSKKQDAHIDSKDATIHIVAHEQVVQIAWLTCLANHVQQISILTMDVSHDADGFGNVDQIWLSLEELKGLREQPDHLGLGDWTLSAQEVFEQLPIRQIVLGPEG